MVAKRRVNRKKLALAIGMALTMGSTQADFPAALELSTLDGSNGFVINGVSADDYSGRSVSNAGDINGDGFEDLVIGAPYASPNGYYSGSSYVVFGSDQGFTSPFNLSSLNGTNGFVINGVNAGDVAGKSVSYAGDINGDGFDDLVIGAPYASPNGNYSGSSYVVFGSDQGFTSPLELSSLNGTNGFAINGVSSFDYAGVSVSAAGDVNGDGFDDLIIGASGASPVENYSGASYVVFGSDQGFAGTLELSGLNGTNGFMIYGAEAYDSSGKSVSSAGDINGDGIDDVIIGAPNASRVNSYSGASFVVFGSDQGFTSPLNLSDLDGNNGLAIYGAAESDFSGISVSNAGDFNVDGIDDVVIGARDADPNGADSGASYVVFGSDQSFSSPLELSGLNSSNGQVINGVSAGDYSGSSVSAAGDVNGDGFSDVIIGAPESSPNGSNSGTSYVVFGADAGLSSPLNLSTLDGSNGLAINGVDESDYSGFSVSGAGDINGDGVDDFLIGAYGVSPNGASYVVFGRSDQTEDFIFANGFE